MGLYTTCRLPHSDSIRILSLRPAPSFRAQIECDLQTTRLSEVITDDPESGYTTISYTWGSPKNQCEIRVNDHRLEIGRNLYTALQNLRRKDRPLKLWADAICINQHDADERSQQVQQMRTIYAISSETIIFLGSDDGSATSSNAWDFLESRSQWALNASRDRDFDIPGQRRKTVDLDRGYNNVLDAVVSREWFRRIWILQEVVVANQLSIQCGERRVPWDDFILTLFTYFRTDVGSESETQFLPNDRLKDSRFKRKELEVPSRMEIVSKLNPGWETTIQPIKEMCQTRLQWQNVQRNPRIRMPVWLLNAPLAHFVENDDDFRQGNLSLSQLLARGRRYHSTDARDKVIALLGICQGIVSPALESLTNYKKTTQQIFREATRVLIESEGTFDVLSQSGQQSEPEDLSFASWAGRWDSTLFPPISVLARLGSESETSTKDRRLVVEKHHSWSVDETILYCTGGKMGRLVAVSDLHIPPSPEKQDYWEPNSRFKEAMEIAGKFSQCAVALLRETPWLEFPDTPDPGHASLERRIVLTDTGGSYWNVDIKASPAGDTTDEESSGFYVRHHISGGLGFIDDVIALQQGRKLGLVRCQSERNEQQTPHEEKARYVFAVVPACARVGDVVASFTGARTLFLVYPDPSSSQNFEAKGALEDDDEEEKRVRGVLPKSVKGGDAEFFHCRLRGECRVNAFEDTWGLVEGSPIMAFHGFVAPEWRDRIFAIH